MFPRFATSPVFCASRRLPALRGLASALACLMALPLCLPFAQMARADTAPAHASLATALQIQSVEKQAKKLADTAQAVPVLHDKTPRSQILVPLSDTEAARLASNPSALTQRPLSPTLLNEVGKFTQPISAATVQMWKRELKISHPSRQRSALLHLWLGEWELAANQQPSRAQWHLTQTQHLTGSRDRLHGLAAYDTATALFLAGAYDDAVDAFHRLLVPQTMLPGYSRRTCARWYRHAAACAGSHEDHRKLGIPEPPRLDPNCGAAALAACLRGLGLPYDYKMVLSVCRVTGEGSSLHDILQAAQKLGLTGRALTADDVGLMALPKPLVAYVEQDHFVALVRADKTGVSYLCSDCGPWPGGRVDLTWKQWHSLSPGLYASVTKPGSAWDKNLAVALSPLPRLNPNFRLASARPLSGLLGSHAVSALLPSLSLLRGHVQRYVSPTPPVGCGYKPTSQQCPPYIICCWDCYYHAMQGGASDGDPVNMSTGEEEYQPAPDLTVYNPAGPPVVWGRVYNSLRDNSSSAGDILGLGWSETYDRSVVCTGVSGNTYSWNLTLSNGAILPFSVPLTTGPAPSHPLDSDPNIVPARPVFTTSTYSFENGTIAVYCTYITSDNTATGTPTPSQIFITFKDRTTLTFNAPLPNAAPIRAYTLTTGVGTTLTINDNAISNSLGMPLLTIHRSTSNNNIVDYVTDCYHRRILYHVGTYANANVPSGVPQSYNELDHVSEIVSDNATTGQDRYAYGYVGVKNNDLGTGNGGETIPFLHSMTVPAPSGYSPTGPSLSPGMTGTSTAYINYSDNTCFVSSLQDGNGNIRTYTSVDGTHTKVAVTNPQAQLIYANTAGFDSHMSKQAETDGNNQPVYQVLQWDPNDPYRPAQAQDGNGKVTSYVWDKYGNMQTMTPPSNGTRTPAATQYGYDYSQFFLGELVSVQQGSKLRTLYTYYPSGLVNTIQTPLAGTVGGSSYSTTTYVYNNLGDVTSINAPGNNATIVNGTDQGMTTTYNYSYDGSSFIQNAAVGQPITVTDNLGHVTHMRYDSQGNMQLTVDALGNETDYSYNAANQPFVTTLPATGQSGSGRATQQNNYQYVGGPLANTVSSNESGNAIRQVNYSLGPEGETQAVSGSTEPVTYTYDALYRLKKLADGNSNSTYYFYNAAGYLAQIAYPGANSGGSLLPAGSRDTVSMTGYDLNGDVTTRVDGNNVTTIYTYNDPESLLTGITYNYPSGYAGGTTGNVPYGYDVYGRRSAMTDGTGSQSYQYDDLDEPLSVSFSYNGLPTKTISYAYNPDGSHSAMASPMGSTSYLYDGAGRMTKMTNPSTQTASWTYLDNNWLWTQKLYNVQRSNTLALSTYSYNAVGQILEINHAHDNGINPLSDFRIPSANGYDGVGNRLTWTSTFQNMPAYNRTVNYTYDTKNQITTDASTGVSYTNNYVYDGGNIGGSGNPTTLRGYSRTYNADNQDASNTYDGNGNPTTYNGTGNPANYNTKYLAYDPENRLTSYSSVLTCGYNGDGLRAWKANASGTRTYFLYDGTDPVCELNSSGSVTAATDFGANGVWGRHSQSADWFYTWDPQGCIAQKIDSSGNAPASTFFNAFGQQTTTNSAPDPFGGFAGQWGCYSDWETSAGGTNSCLALMTHRFYDPNAGRFLTRDPIGRHGGINLYAYVTNNPVNETDHLGLAPDWDKLLGTCKRFCKPAALAFGAVGAYFGCKSFLDDGKCTVAIQNARHECQTEMERTPVTGNPDDDDTTNIPGVDGPYGNGSGNSLAALNACIEKKLKSGHMPNINQCLKKLFKDGAGSYGSAPGGPTVPYIPGH